MHTKYTMIRILPMDKNDEFGGIEISKLQSSFFLDELPKRKDENGSGRYHYKKQGLVVDNNQTLVLFQYDNKIVACAELSNIKKFDKPRDGYKGALYFEPTSIKVFDAIDNQQINNIFHCSIQFGQIKYKLDTRYLENFFTQLKNVKEV